MRKDNELVFKQDNDEIRSVSERPLCLQCGNWMEVGKEGMQRPAGMFQWSS